MPTIARQYVLIWFPPSGATFRHLFRNSRPNPPPAHRFAVPIEVARLAQDVTSNALRLPVVLHLPGHSAIHAGIHQPFSASVEPTEEWISAQQLESSVHERHS